MDQVTFNQYVEQVIIGKRAVEDLEGHLGNVKMVINRKAPIDDRYVGEHVSEPQLCIDAIVGADPKPRTVYNAMFPMGRYIETVPEIDIEILKQKLLQYIAELTLV